jgi:hypothetical protein
MENKFTQILKYILQVSWFPVIFFIFEVFVISLILYGLTNFIPHDFEFIKGYGILSWAVLVASFRMFTYKIQEKDAIEEAITSRDESDITDPILDRSTLKEEKDNNFSPRNIYEAPDREGSTRE